MPRTRLRLDRSLWGYNLRILLGNSYWLIVTPIVATMLVLFWNIATAGLGSAGKCVQTIEVLAPLLGAMLCAYMVAPEQGGVAELVFVRPISMEKLLLLRLVTAFGFVLVLLIPPLAIYRLTVPEFPVLLTVFSALCSAIFLSALAMALASATRQPLLGLGLAGAFWAFDLALGSVFNPALTLHGLADQVSGSAQLDLWAVSKTLLVVLGALLYLWNRSLLGRPTAPRRPLVLARNVAFVVLLLLAYVYTGAAAKVLYLTHNEARLGNQSWMLYQHSFRPYGPVPVAWLFGPGLPGLRRGRARPHPGAGEAQPRRGGGEPDASGRAEVPAEHVGRQHGLRVGALRDGIPRLPTLDGPYRGGRRGAARRVHGPEHHGRLGLPRRVREAVPAQPLHPDRALRAGLHGRLRARLRDGHHLL